MQFEHLTDAPGFASIHEEEIRLEEGLAVAVVANPVDDDHDRLDVDTPVELVSSDDRVLGIARLEFDPDEEEEKSESRQRGDWYFVIFGHSVGSTAVEVFIDGELEQEIPAMVEEPSLQ